MKTEIISIGNELIFGRIADTNASYLSMQLCREGVEVCYHTAVGDIHNNIKTALSVAAGRVDLIIATGGLGPTMDDLTRHVVANFCGLDLILNEKLWDEIKGRFAKKGIAMSDNNKVQAMIPSGTIVIPNATGTASGILVSYRNKEMIFLPGVPSEMKLMVNDWVIPYIRKKIDELDKGQKSAGNNPNRFTLIRDIKTYGISESLLGKKIEHLMGQEKNPIVGTQASAAGIIVRLCARADTKENALNLAEDTVNKVKQALGKAVFGIDDVCLADTIVSLLKKHEFTIAVAESCTGGLVSHLLTNVSGASDCLMEGIVAYSNDAKINILHVNKDLILKHGAVSSQTACAMAIGVRKLAGSDIGIGITGIAGPTGDTPDKPVGLVHIAIDVKGSIFEEEHRFSGNREDIKTRVAHTALNLVRLRLLDMADCGCG